MSAAAGAPTASATSRPRFFIAGVNLAAQSTDRLLAFGQIAVVAAVLGEGPSADIYFLAAIAPFALGLVLGDPLSRATLTLLVRSRDAREGATLATTALLLVSIALLIATAVYAAVAIAIVHTFEPGGSASVWPWLAFATVIPAIGVGAAVGAVALWRERYVLAAARVPAATGAGLVLTLAVSTVTHSPTWIAAAVAAGYAIATTVTLIYVLGLLDHVSITRDSIRRTLAVRSMIWAPALSGVVGNQVIVALERALATQTGSGSVAAISYARGIAGAPVVMGQAVGAGTYPALVRNEVAGHERELARLVLSGLRVACALGVLGAAFFLFFGRPALSVLLERGAFSSGPALRSGTILMVFSLSTGAGTVVSYLGQVLYGINRFRSVLVLELVIFVPYLVLAPLLRIGWDLRGLALAFGIAQLCGATWASFSAARSVGSNARAVMRDVVLAVTPWAAVLTAVLGISRAVAASIDAGAGGATAIGVAGAVLGVAVAGYAVPFAEVRSAHGLMRRVARPLSSPR